MNRSVYIIPTFFLVFVLCVPVAWAGDGGGEAPGTGSLSGRIADKGGAPLVGASVYIPDLKLGVISDTAGYYRFPSLPSGKYLIEVHSIGTRPLRGR